VSAPHHYDSQIDTVKTGVQGSVGGVQGPEIVKNTFFKDSSTLEDKVNKYLSAH